MYEKKVTIDDIKFLIKRLISVVEQFNERIDKAYLLEMPKPIINTKEPTKEDLQILERLRMRANFSTYLTREERDILLNPTPSQFSKFKREYRRSIKKIENEMAEQTSADILSLKKITISVPIVNTVFSEKDACEGRIIVSGHYRDYGTIGLIGKLNDDNIFPMDVFVCKQDFTPGKRKYQVLDKEYVLAIIDPKPKSVHLSTHLIKLAIRHSANFKGLIYLKPI